MALNVEAGTSTTGYVSGSALVYAPELLAYESLNGIDITQVSTLGFISINDLMTLANDSLASNPVTTSAGAARSYQEALKDVLDHANNNLNFVLPSFP